LVGFVALGGLLLAACPADPRNQDPHRVMAQVGEEKIQRDEFVAELLRLGVPRSPDAAAREKVARRILDRWIEEELYLAAAEQAGITVAEEDITRAIQRHTEGYPAGYFRRVLHAEQLTPELHRKKLGRSLRIDAFLKARLATLPAPTVEEARARFEKEGKKRQLPAEVRVRQVLVETEEEARYIRNQVTNKRLRMDQAAARFSKAPEARKGGDLGWFGKGTMPEVFDVVFDLKLETLSQVVSSPYGFHIFEVLDQRPAREETFAMAQKRLMAEVRSAHEQETMSAVLKELKSKIAITVYDEALKKAVADLPEAPPAPEPQPEAQNNPAPAPGVSP
jgi:parvulin-like peptidyl-prolyl isomerase